MLGTGEVIVILGAVTLLFGGKKLPEFAKNLGKGMREFKKALAGEEERDEGVVIIPEVQRKDEEL